MSPKRVAVYMRVSKKDGSQTTANQEPEVLQLARQRGEVVLTFTEQGSAVKHRPQFQTMLTAARRGAFDVLAVWSLDRFGRSTVGNLVDLVALESVGVEVVSVRESWLSTAPPGPLRQILVAVVSGVAEMERQRLIERTHAGLETARRQGKRLGRPRAERRHQDQKGARLDVDAARGLLSAGTSQRETARRLGVPESTLRRALGRTAPKTSTEPTTDPA